MSEQEATTLPEDLRRRRDATDSARSGASSPRSPQPFDPAQGRLWGGRGAEEVLRRWLLEVLLAPVERHKMTYEEFLAWADEDTLAEWVDGEVVMYSPASDQHQDLSDFLTSILRIYVESHGLGWVRSAPFQMKTGPDLPGREPDLLFVAGEHLGRLKETYLDGPADLAVEIVSPESVGRDRGEKFYEYEQAGVPEYWLIDPLREQVEFYQLDAQGRYRMVMLQEEGIYHSAVLPGFWLRVGWLWEPPSVLEVLRELDLI